ncbi:hypothetical protein RJ640_026486 [Escallonia rubra]|uniref:RING-type domain-containing protein n=1 Tax=Escallonia rubra TaxID=112253 RepID=A0AA88QN40_9ASTE|nr:hypothetical protein RJ640_026486 [Escallonia rubra]
MGSSSSKPNAAEPSSTAGFRRSRSMGTRVLHSSCLGGPSGSHDSDCDEQVFDYQSKGNGRESPCENQRKYDLAHSGQGEGECYRKVEVEAPNKTTCVSSNIELDEWGGQSSFSDAVSRAGSTSSRAFSSRSMNPSSRFLSRFRFFPGNASFRLRRTSSLGSSRGYHGSSTSFAIPNDDEEVHPHTGPSNELYSRNEAAHGCDLLPACVVNRSRRRHGKFTSCFPSSSGFSGNSQGDQITSTQDDAIDISNTREELDISLRSPRNQPAIDGPETRLAGRRTGVREPAEGNVLFSRTLSVGRLRDRVLRRSSFPDLISYPLQQFTEVRAPSQPISLNYSSSNMSSSFYNSQEYEVGTSHVREARYHDLLEHRSDFLERRRRIRSQVRALQRMGSRFENMSGHERSCILSGQHRRGHCTCRVGSRSSDDTSTRASISRIVMLAEALFEVLDEIHQQSVVLSSRPSASSVISVPAPHEVVNSLPIKLYTKVSTHLNEEAVQCYICLVEYEEGDSVRVLPCHHEFHRSCVDKWLKEIHRICPLCRGDICRSDSLTAET